MRGIHPPVLADRGLSGGVEALALAQPRPVEVDIDLPGRPPAPVESAVYFAVAEALTNSAKHAAAQSSWVWVRHDGRSLTALVGDNGVGGAQLTPGGGLAGIESQAGGVRRHAVDGQPAGRPDDRDPEGAVRPDGGRRRELARSPRSSDESPRWIRSAGIDRLTEPRIVRRAGRVRIVLAEDLALLRDGMIRLLTAYQFEVVEAVDNGPSLLRALTTHRPDVAVVDVRLPPTFTDEGLRAALAARAQMPGLPVLVLSQYVEQLYARELLAQGTGGVGYLLKDRISDVNQFVDAIRRVAAGGTAMDPEVISQLLSRHQDSSPVGVVDAPRTRGALAHGGGPVERGDRRPDVHHREGRRQAHELDLRQARTGAERGRQPPGAGRAGLPGERTARGVVALDRSTCRSDM